MATDAHCPVCRQWSAVAPLAVLSNSLQRRGVRICSRILSQSVDCNLSPPWVVGRGNDAQGSRGPPVEFFLHLCTLSTLNDAQGNKGPPVEFFLYLCALSTLNDAQGNRGPPVEFFLYLCALSTLNERKAPSHGTSEQTR